TNHLPGSVIEGIVVNLHDITEQRKADEALRDAHERFRSAFVHAPIGMAITDLEGRILWANAAYGQIVGRRAEDLSGSSVHEFTHPEDRESAASEMARLVTGRSEGYRVEKRYLASSGHELWVSVAVSCVKDTRGEPLYLIVQAEDVTERRMFRERLAHAAIHDPLTGLPNRILFMDRLEMALSRARRQERRVAVVFLDLDNFKLVNDSMGHEAGDRLLVAVASRLKAAVRSSDTLARLGGDEFAVVCEEILSHQAALEGAQRLAEALGEAFSLEGEEVFLTASLGLAVSGHLGDSASSLLRDADTAMYMAKERGRARIEVFDHSRHEQAVDRMQLSSELHHALARRQLKVFYQPVAELPGGRLAGMEALLRWVHPTRGLLHPGEFLRMAEDSGLIVPIGEWVIEQACRQFVAWEAERARRGSPPLSLGVAVNLSPRQLASPDLVRRLGSILEETGMDPASLWVEIVEGALVDDVDSTLEVLRSLSGLGVRLSIDDFGSGYSSLGYLRSFPVQAVKIDRSFVEGLAGGRGEDSIVRSVLSLAHSLGLACIAEGVEAKRQLDSLVELGCRFVQGFLLGVPLPAETLGDSLADDLSSWAVDSSVMALPARKSA
ncbi:MAG TPA: EAL domain-containing protein, partial [Acidimicrobiales bacterium]|nr:EAL domain-containing protein [Acidimicrobiales bacterium]